MVAAGICVLATGLAVGASVPRSANPSPSRLNPGDDVVRPSGSPWTGWRIPSIHVRAIKVTSGTQLLRLFRRCSNPGGQYDASTLTVSFSTRVIVDAKCPDKRGVTILLGRGVRFVSSTVANDPAVDVTAAQNLTIYGGDVSNPLGAGVTVRGNRGTPTRNVKWWGFQIHDTAQGGLFVNQQSGDVQHVDLRGDISSWSKDLALDPHNTKGTGLHGAYIGVTSDTGLVSDSTFVLDVHDSPYGSGVQLGPNLHEDEVQVKAANLLCNPPSGADGTCGNAITIFGGNQSDLRIVSVEASNVRRVVEASSLDDIPPGSISVTFGRSSNVRLIPAYYDRNPGIFYSNVR